MTLIDWLVALLIVAPLFPALLVGVLVYRRVWTFRSPSLRERALLGFRDWLVASIAALLALQHLGLVSLPHGIALPLLAIAMLLVSIPSAYWLLLYFRGGFR